MTDVVCLDLLREMTPRHVFDYARWRNGLMALSVIQSSSRALPLGRLPRERFRPWVETRRSPITCRRLPRTSRSVKGFGRRPPARGSARHGEAGVRKPPKEETAFRGRRWRSSHDLWGFEDRRLSAP